MGALSTLTAEHCSGKRKHSNRLWALFVLEKWFARYAPGFALSMCGIGGFFAQAAGGAAGRGRDAGGAAPRGPDAHHAKLWDRNGLLHARLSIIDPRPLADQPMANEAGDVWIVYNGEVYDWEAAAADLKAHAASVPVRTLSSSCGAMKPGVSKGCPSSYAACSPSQSSISPRARRFSHGIEWGKSR